MSKRSQLMIALTKEISNLCKSIKYKKKSIEVLISHRYWVLVLRSIMLSQDLYWLAPKPTSFYKSII